MFTIAFKAFNMKKTGKKNSTVSL